MIGFFDEVASAFSTEYADRRYAASARFQVLSGDGDPIENLGNADIQQHNVTDWVLAMTHESEPIRYTSLALNGITFAQSDPDRKGETTHSSDEAFASFCLGRYTKGPMLMRTGGLIRLRYRNKR